MSKIIKVTIEATAGAGKSALAHAIADGCKHYGIKCSITGLEDDRPGLLESTWTERMKALAAKGHTVEIETTQLRRAAR